MTQRQYWQSLIGACALALLSACGSTAPTRFYTLEPDSTISRVSDSSAATNTQADFAVAVGPFRFAEYLDRPHVVSRRGATGLDLAEFDRWAAPLPAMFQRTVASNLAAAMQSTKVLEFPTTLPFESGYQITGRVTRFDTDALGQALLIVQWGVQSAGGEVLRNSVRSQYRSDSLGKEYADRIRAQSATVAAFSRDIANTLVELSVAASSDRP